MLLLGQIGVSESIGAVRLPPSSSTHTNSHHNFQTYNLGVSTLEGMVIGRSVLDSHNTHQHTSNGPSGNTGTGNTGTSNDRTSNTGTSNDRTSNIGTSNAGTSNTGTSNMNSDTGNETVAKVNTASGDNNGNTNTSNHRIGSSNIEREGNNNETTTTSTITSTSSSSSTLSLLSSSSSSSGSLTSQDINDREPKIDTVTKTASSNSPSPPQNIKEPLKSATETKTASSTSPSSSQNINDREPRTEIEGTASSISSSSPQNSNKRESKKEIEGAASSTSPSSAQDNNDRESKTEIEETASTISPSSPQNINGREPKTDTETKTAADQLQEELRKLALAKIMKEQFVMFKERLARTAEGETTNGPTQRKKKVLELTAHDSPLSPPSSPSSSSSSPSFSAGGGDGVSEGDQSVFINAGEWVVIEGQDGRLHVTRAGNVIGSGSVGGDEGRREGRREEDYRILHVTSEGNIESVPGTTTIDNVAAEGRTVLHITSAKDNEQPTDTSGRKGANIEAEIRAKELTTSQSQSNGNIERSADGGKRNTGGDKERQSSSSSSSSSGSGRSLQVGEVVVKSERRAGEDPSGVRSGVLRVDAHPIPVTFTSLPGFPSFARVPATGVGGGQAISQLPSAVGPGGAAPTPPSTPITLPLAFPRVPGTMGSRHSSLLGASTPARRTQVGDLMRLLQSRLIGGLRESTVPPTTTTTTTSTTSTGGGRVVRPSPGAPTPLQHFDPSIVVNFLTLVALSQNRGVGVGGGGSSQGQRNAAPVELARISLPPASPQNGGEFGPFSTGNNPNAGVDPSTIVLPPMLRQTLYSYLLPRLASLTALVETVPGVPGLDYPIIDTVPYTNFYCSDMPWPGFYADTEARCQSAPYLYFLNERIFAVPEVDETAPHRTLTAEVLDTIFV
ncbi:hypothetical protein Pcinc_041499 [Petrolisthes cinctipes]|uniref:Uncharacterized protein n=1 Tax=Petrolisthes cinctipes TaxID=88211 RepID=A0AAE1BME8_PETCI|nr:hypothetical protein Pcinc_041499 [Petrolisthes cinctipes]